MSKLTDRIDEAWSTLAPQDLDRFLRELAEEVERDQGTHTADYATVMNELGTFLRVTAQYQDGEQAFLKALPALEEIAGRDSDVYATCLDNLGELYRLCGDLDSCERCLTEADQLFVDKGSREYAACLNYQGHLAEARQDPARARQCYLRSLEIVERIEPESLDLATGYQNVANAYQAQGDLTHAEEYLRRAMDLYDRGVLTINAHYISLLNQIAALELKQGRADDAERSFDQAVADLPKTTASPIDAIVVYANAGTLYHARGKADKCAAAAAQIDRIAQMDALADHPLVVRLSSLARSWEC